MFYLFFFIVHIGLLRLPFSLEIFFKYLLTYHQIASSKLRQIHTDCGTRLSTKKRWTDAQTSPRLWNLYLALSKRLTAKKIELYGVFLSPATLLLQKISGG